ncbi:MAG: hypothetical protein KGD58_01460 [Candidatus Lokiarchaeota archaeon]|nr:hypothetical protein [Candidatus Lokiarchaeota archaeon]
MITTRESINYQFSLIFGYSSPNDIITGDVIGPGRLTRKKVNELSREIIQFLTMYNAILRDYTGSEVFSIEFNLHNLDEQSAKTNIYPKSMIFLPGRFKDCENLLLALKPETGYLDVHKTRNSVNDICKLFYEVEEFADRSELKIENKQLLYDKFASRFSKKLFGDLIENKWNKKLIGLSASLPTEKEMLNVYAKIISNVEILWNKTPIEINLLDSKFEKIKTPFEGQQALEHLKYSISEPSANFVIDKTLNLGTSLINLANLGTLDEFQDDIVNFLIFRIKEEIEDISEIHTGEWLVAKFNKILLSLEVYINKFLEYSNTFLTSGEIGELSELLERYKQFIVNKGRLENVDFAEICNYVIKFINRSIIQKETLRSIELSSVFNYFSEINRKSIALIRTSLPNYLSRRRLKTLTNELIENLKQKFNKEQKPAKILGINLLNKFQDYLINQIEIESITLTKNLLFDEKKLINNFIKLVSNNLETFFDKINLKIEDLVSFAETQMESNTNVINSHLEKFKRFSNELNYLLSYILRHSTINRYIKEEFSNETIDPVSFANKFHRFLEKRIGGINLAWSSYVLDWIIDYSKKFLKIENKKDWTLNEIYFDFLEYLENREQKEQKLENFLQFLDSYISKIANVEEKNNLFEFYKQYEFSIGINEEFPKYVKNKVMNELTLKILQQEELPPIEFFKIGGEEAFYKHIKNMDLKYFSKLIPQPLTLILKHNLTEQEKDLFKGELFHVINFKFWHNNVRFELSDNFKEVYREWMK